MVWEGVVWCGGVVVNIVTGLFLVAVAVPKTMAAYVPVFAVLCRNVFFFFPRERGEARCSERRAFTQCMWLRWWVKSMT